MRTINITELQSRHSKSFFLSAEWIISIPEIHAAEAWEAWSESWDRLRDLYLPLLLGRGKKSQSVR